MNENWLRTNALIGTDSDSNILKIYRMLNRNNGDQHYYQPGIGTYVNTASLSHKSMKLRVKSWYLKAKDSAVGTSFDEHVMGGYKFLMKAYVDHDIIMFGFSRGAYIARFLAEMLDHVGLLSAGNEEMAYFAWKAFSQWQEREEGNEEGIKKKKEMFTFLRAFRETFSRPVRRIRFLGLFDTGTFRSGTLGLEVTNSLPALVHAAFHIHFELNIELVNSVPRFENAWMQRSRFPYTARSSAKIIRHAVSIDERRAKFRSDLISGSKLPSHHHHHIPGLDHVQNHIQRLENGIHHSVPEPLNEPPPKPQYDRFRRRSSQFRPTSEANRAFTPQLRIQQEEHGGGESLQVEGRGRRRSTSPADSRNAVSDNDCSSVHSVGSFIPIRHPDDDDDEDEAAEQNIEELWFPGGHADLGGGWPLLHGEEAPLSHGPLVWMVREAQRAGLDFDPEKMLQLKCCDEDFDMAPPTMQAAQGQPIPEVQVTGSSDSPKPPDLFRSPHSDVKKPGWAPGLQPEAPKQSSFLQALHSAATKGVLHDCLEFNNGLGKGSVITWKVMEYLPFRRMDLKPDGSWKAISLPLPMGETRDIPDNAWIHHSAIKRMQVDESYRPGNLIVGGGGRGIRIAPNKAGTGEWVVHKNEGDPVGEVYMRKKVSLVDEK